ncbi:MAG TPA: OB-fold nucleic acid binding domain-containing protein [Bryobacteraceae bacterium]|nr:OB-fold nucleic acid binding domain-containing protein [Bryobacteraceae bacterium]
MKSPYVSELQPNQLITAVFLVQHKDIRQKKTGEPYLSLVLGDRTGEIDAKMWDNVTEVMDSFERDDFLKVRGLLQVHQNRLQLTLHKLQRQESATIDAADYFPASQRNPDEMFAELQQYVAAMQNVHLKGLMEALFADAEIARRFKIAPAAKNIHHAYLSGLLEHVVSLCGLAKMMAAHYRTIDLDLLISGVILHDIGKIYELTYDRSFSYSTEGQLLGHIIIALRMVEDKVRSLPGFPPKLRTLLDHMIVSHHGELEYGSPKLPAFPEALLLHHLDNLDAKMETMRAFLEKDRQVDGCWTGYSPSLERSVLKKLRFLDNTPAPAVEPRPPQPIAHAAAAPRTAAPPSSHFAQMLQGALKKVPDA